MDNSELKEWIKSHEGYKSKLYKCSAGKYTIGIGRNLEDVGITAQEADTLLTNDIARIKLELTPYSWYHNQLEDVRCALVNMCFNLGLTKLLKFKKMLCALESGDFPLAAKEALNSKWAKQVPNRANDIATVIRNGK